MAPPRLGLVVHAVSANALLEAALSYAARGWHVFPCTPREKLPLTEHGWKDATCDAAAIEHWWAEREDSNVAVATGPSSLVVLDFDGRQGGLRTLDELEEKHTVLRLAPRVKTADGFHIWFTGSVRSRATGRPGFEVKSQGRYVLAPPSVHPDGPLYCWVKELNAWPPPFPPELAIRWKPIDDKLTAWADKALADEIAVLAATPKGQRNEQLNKSAFSLGQIVGAGHLERGRVEVALLAAANANGSVEDDGEDAARATIRSGLDGGVEKPREPKESVVLEGGRVAGSAARYPALVRARTRVQRPVWPAPLAPGAYHGLVGDFVRMVMPHTESDPAALLVQFLVGFGNLVGRGPHFAVEADRHTANEFALLVGETSRGRKGTAWGQALRPLRAVDAAWADQRQQGGLSSGEGLIWAVRDPIQTRSAIRQKGRVVGYEDVEEDPGIKDKRLLVFEPEFASTLRVMERDGSTLSPVVRQAWDVGDLRVLTKKSPAKATGAHISIIGHVTRDELLRYLDRTEAANGFINRFLPVCVRRARLLPEGGRLDEVDFSGLYDALARAVEWGRTRTELRRDEGARALWYDVYGTLSEGLPGLLGAVTSRAEAHVVRLSLLYALLDGADCIGRVHLEAALALWRYAADSARYIFGDSLGNPVADDLLETLRGHSEGLTRTEISGHFGRHQRSDEVARALATLQDRGLIRVQREGTAGREAERWFAVQGAKEANEAPEPTTASSLVSLTSHPPEDAEPKPSVAPSHSSHLSQSAEETDVRPAADSGPSTEASLALEEGTWVG
jgi:hypothetical protein